MEDLVADVEILGWVGGLHKSGCFLSVIAVPSCRPPSVIGCVTETDFKQIWTFQFECGRTAAVIESSQWHGQIEWYRQTGTRCWSTLLGAC